METLINPNQIRGSGECTLQVQVSYDNEVLGNCSVVVDNTTIVTKSNGLATFTGLTKGEKVIEATKKRFFGCNRYQTSYKCL